MKNINVKDIILNNESDDIQGDLFEYIDPNNLAQENVEKTKNDLLLILKNPKHYDKKNIIRDGLKMLYTHKYVKEINCGEYKNALSSVNNYIKYNYNNQDKQQIDFLKRIIQINLGELKVNEKRIRFLEHLYNSIVSNVEDSMKDTYIKLLLRILSNTQGTNNVKTQGTNNVNTDVVYGM